MRSAANRSCPATHSSNLFLCCLAPEAARKSIWCSSIVCSMHASEHTQALQCSLCCPLPLQQNGLDQSLVIVVAAGLQITNNYAALCLSWCAAQAECLSSGQLCGRLFYWCCSSSATTGSWDQAHGSADPGLSGANVCAVCACGANLHADLHFPLRVYR